MKTITIRLKLFLAVFTLLLTTHVATAQPLVGNYSINSLVPASTTNFQTFNAFAASINTNGVSGNVTVTVEPGSGPYNEQVVINSISGSGPTAIVTLEGSGETLTAATNTNDRHVLRLSGVQYFNINNLHVVRDAASTSGFYGIHIYNTGSNINVTGCNIEIPATNSTLTGAVIASGSTTSILATGDFHNITVSGNIFSGGGYGVSVFGLISNLASGILINDNSFTDFHDNGVYLRETDGAVISNNRFDKVNTNITSLNAIQIAQAANINADIHGNYIKVSQTNNGTMTIRGIYLFNGTGHKVYNNVIHEIALTAGNFSGIEVRTGATAPEIYYNTISIDNAITTSGELFGIAEELSNTNSVLRNNVISITQPTINVKAGLVLATNSVLSTAFNSNNNLVWVPGGNVAMKNALTPTFYASMANWQSASSNDANSLSLDPLFVLPVLPQPTNPLAGNAGVAIPSITTDVLGITRGTPPDIGAYEFIPSGIYQIEGGNLLTCYPNPAVDHLTVKLPFENGTVNVYIYKADGGLVKTFTTMNAGNKIDIATLEFEPGIYQVKIDEKGKSYRSTFVKQ